MSKPEQFQKAIEDFLTFQGGTDDKWYLQASIQHYLKNGKPSGSLSQAIAEIFNAGANWKASQHEWVACSERLPKFSDGDADGLVDVARWSTFEKRWVRCAAMHWTALDKYPDFIWCKRNTNFPEPPRTEI